MFTIHITFSFQTIRTMCQTKQLRISKNASGPGTKGFCTHFEREHELPERSDKVDCLKNESIGTQTPLRKTQSALHVTGTKLSVIPMAARSLALLWRRSSQSQPAQQNPIEQTRSGECLTVEDIKQRWRRQQMAIQQKNVESEKVSIWSVLTRSRRCLR